MFEDSRNYHQHKREKSMESSTMLTYQVIIFRLSKQILKLFRIFLEIL